MINYCKQFFGKSLLDLTYEDVQLFFEEEREESNILEFKSGQTNVQEFDGTLNKKIIRAIASFLNSEGGLLIWGSPREVEKEKGNKKVKVAAGPLQPNTVFNEKDQLINKIIRSISYMPTGVTLVILEFGGLFLYVFEVQESTAKPHQYADQYPIRIDGQTVPAPHYLVDSMFKAIKIPEIDGRIIFSGWGETATRLFLNFAVVIENRSVFINETNFTYQLMVSNSGIFNKSQIANWKSENVPVLHFGRNIFDTHECMFVKTRNYLNEIKLTLIFGGQIGLSKSSSYTINSSKFNQEQLFDFSSYVEHFEENVSFKEKQESLGVSFESSFENLIQSIRPSKSKPAT